MAIDVRSTLKKLFYILIPLSVVGFFVATGFHYVPVDLTVGKCMMDYTSSSSYESRISPLESLEFEIERENVLVCYGSPGARGRKVFGELVEFDRIWRFGANEPTRLYTSADLVIGEVMIPKGRYSLYAVPGRTEWEVFISESTFHWGNDINNKVREREIGSIDVEPSYNPDLVEQFRIRYLNNALIVEWEHTRLTIPVIYIGE